MSQYAHYSETTPGLATVLSQLPSAPLLDVIYPTRQGLKMLFANLGKAQECTLPLGGHTIFSIPLWSVIADLNSVDSLYTVKDYQVPVDDGEILVRSVVPTPMEGEKGDYPLFVWYQAGGMHLSLEQILKFSQYYLFPGFVMGDVNMSDAFLRRVCVQFRVSVLNVEHRYAVFLYFRRILSENFYSALLLSSPSRPGSMIATTP